MKIKTLLLIIILPGLSACSDDLVEQAKRKLISEKESAGIYGKYVYVDNTDSQKMNGTLELSYSKNSSGGDVFLGKVDVDRTDNNEPVNCTLFGNLSMVDVNTYQLSNLDESLQKFTLLLKKTGDRITITSNIPVVGCEKNSDKALFHSYTKVS